MCAHNVRTLHLHTTKKQAPTNRLNERECQASQAGSVSSYPPRYCCCSSCSHIVPVGITEIYSSLAGRAGSPLFHLAVLFVC